MKFTNVQRLVLARQIVKELLYKGLKKSTWGGRHPQAWSELCLSDQDLEEHVFKVITGYEKRLANVEVNRGF